MPKLPPRKRIKPKYNPITTAREKAFHLWLMDTFPCVCGCGKRSTVVHHPLQRHHNQRWRRDHEFVVPMDGYCHMDLHQKNGSDKYAEAAAQYRQQGIDAGLLDV
jgi:hypothetical protein